MRQGFEAARQAAGWGERLKLLLAALGPDDLVIDCGANVGLIAAKFAGRGCSVRCFEPDPQAFEQLGARLGDNHSCELNQAAVWLHAGRARLYFHPERSDPGSNLTQSSSLMADKINVSPGSSTEVELVDFPALLRSLKRKAALVKIDIEGAEGELLLAILEQGLEDRFELCVVETHERKVPSSRASMQQVRAMIAERGLGHIWLDWK